MILNKLYLTNFRNYSKLELNFDSAPTIFIGSNGAGKSNILEAVYLLSTSKSPRVDEEVELIKKLEEAATIKGVVENGGEQNELMITMVGDPSSVGTSSDVKKFGKRVAVNGVGRRVIDFIGNLPSVIFWPSDINMVTGSPSLRRWHLDLSLAQADSSYKKKFNFV
jgi:DNA replication and repair protein RecF